MDLVNYVPEFITQSPTFSALYNEEQSEVNTVNTDALDLQNQCFVDTSTWGISDWESFYGIPININNKINYRRSNVLAKIRGRGTSTVTLVQNVANSYENGQVQVIEDATHYQFTIKFIGNKGIPPNIDDLKASIERIKPAHLEVIYAYNYTLWSEVRASTWGTTRTVTWGNLKLVDKIEVPIYKTWDTASTMSWNEAEGYIWDNLI